MEVNMVCMLSTNFAPTSKQESMDDFYDENEKKEVMVHDEHTYAFLSTYSMTIVLIYPHVV